MKARLIAALLLTGVGAVLSISLLAQQTSPTAGVKEKIPPLGTETRHIGNAEVKSLVNTGFDPSRQPEVYWHDSDWRVDLVIPPADSADDSYSLDIRSSDGRASTVKLPEVYGQINSITRTPGNKVVIDADCGGTCVGFMIVDLRRAKVIDDIGVEDLSISPNGRFILFARGFPLRIPAHENIYQLYDAAKSPRENVCGWDPRDPKHQQLSDDWRGFQVYPQKPGQILCSEPLDLNDDNTASNYTWAPDSSKIVFADVKSGVMSLILVAMPVGASDLPKTSTYPLVGAENVCAGATDAAGQPYCDYHDIQSLGWDGDAVTATFNHRFGTPLDLKITIPVSKFVPVGK